MFSLFSWFFSINSVSKLPQALSVYNDKDFELKQRVGFFFYLGVSLLLFLLIGIPISIYNNFNVVNEHSLNYSILYIEIISSFFLFFSLFLLIRGNYSIASHLLIITSLATIWGVMFVNNEHILVKADTISIIISLLIIPTFYFSNKLIKMIFYIGGNIFMLFIFAFHALSIGLLPENLFFSYVFDQLISILLVAIIGYNIFAVHKRSLDTAKEEILNRSLIEIDLQKNEEQFHIAFDNAPTGMSMINIDGMYVMVNPYLSDMLGYSFEEFLSFSMFSIIHPDDKIKFEEWFNLSMSAIVYNEELEKRIIHKNGSIVWVLLRAKWIKNENGKPVNAVTHIVDITQKKKQQEALQQSELQYRTLFESANDSISVINSQGIYTNTNSITLELFGCTASDIIGNSPAFFSPVLQPDGKTSIEKAVDLIHLAFSGRSQRFEWKHKKLDGTLLDTEVCLNVIYISDEPYLLAIVRDMTERKQIENELIKHQEHLETLVKERTEELATINSTLSKTNQDLCDQQGELQQTIDELQKAQQQLVQSEKMASLGVLAAGIAHEINNPLNFIQGGYIGIDSYFDSNVSKNKSEVQPFLYAINEGVQRATEIVKSLGRYARKDESSVYDCDINSILDNSIIMLQNTLKDKVRILKKYYVDKPCICLANEPKLQQVFVNIISNAEQAIDKDGELVIETLIEDSFVYIKISDNGNGISQEILTKITDPFFTTKPPGKGTGLGLAISYSIIHEFNGTIDFESEVGKGTIVKIKLPRISV